MPFECIMCMERLDTLAPDSSAANPVPVSNPEQPGTGPGPTRKSRVSLSDRPESRIEVCGTVCGHMFHRVCLIRWFRQDGGKTCPSCRKPLGVSNTIQLKPAGLPELSNNALELGDLGISQIDCSRLQCILMGQKHRNLVGEYTDLVQKIADKSDEANLLTAQNASLEEEEDLLKQKLALLDAFDVPSKTNVNAAAAIKKQTAASCSHLKTECSSTSDSSTDYISCESSTDCD